PSRSGDHVSRERAPQGGAASTKPLLHGAEISFGFADELEGVVLQRSRSFTERRSSSRCSTSSGASCFNEAAPSRSGDLGEGDVEHCPIALASTKPLLHGAEIR